MFREGSREYVEIVEWSIRSGRRGERGQRCHSFDHDAGQTAGVHDALFVGICVRHNVENVAATCTEKGLVARCAVMLPFRFEARHAGSACDLECLPRVAANLVNKSPALTSPDAVKRLRGSVKRPAVSAAATARLNRIIS